MRTKIGLIILTIVITSRICLAEEINPSQILEKVMATYNSMNTYQSEGKIVSEIISGETKLKTITDFSMRLQKPNLYKIYWTQEAIFGVPQSGCVWNDGVQPYLYMGMTNAYSKMKDDEIALAGATGISGGAAFSIPSLFLKTFKEELIPFSRLLEPKINRIEQIEGEECYVITGASTTFKEETFWISKKRFVIIQYSHSLEMSEKGKEVPEMTEQEIEEAILSMGQKVTEETKEQMKNMMKMAKETMEKTDLKGFSTETHSKISFPEFSKQDFEYKLPEGAILKESLFDNVLGSQ